MSRFVVIAVCVGLILSLGGCSGDDADQAGDTEPPERAGPVTDIQACDLLRRQQMLKALNRPIRVVGEELGAPTLPTESCWWGNEFGVSQIDVQVTPGPVAEDTFQKAFGPDAGGNPQRIKQLGTAAYARDGMTSRTLHVFENGVVLSIEAKDDPGDPLPERALSRVARAALGNLPDNPQLADGHQGGPCGDVGNGAIAAAMDADTEMRRAFPGKDGAIMCSWTGLPGNVVATVRTDQVQITNYQANLSARVYEQVDGIDAEAWSQNDQAGDLLIFLDDSLVEVSTLPGEGFSDAGVPTTDGEQRLANALVRTFG